MCLANTFKTILRFCRLLCYPNVLLLSGRNKSITMLVIEMKSDWQIFLIAVVKNFKLQNENSFFKFFTQLPLAGGKFEPYTNTQRLLLKDLCHSQPPDEKFTLINLFSIFFYKLLVNKTYTYLHKSHQVFKNCVEINFEKIQKA